DDSALAGWLDMASQHGPGGFGGGEGFGGSGELVTSRIGPHAAGLLVGSAFGAATMIGTGTCCFCISPVKKSSKLPVIGCRQRVTPCGIGVGFSFVAFSL